MTPNPQGTTTSPIASVLAALGSLKVHDVSPLLDSELPMWFLYPQPELTPLLTHDRGPAAANSITLAEHTGTHVDAPFHFDPHGAHVDELAVDSLLLRPYKKFDLTSDDHHPGDLVGLEHLKAAAARGGFTLERGDVAILELGWDRYLPDGSDARERAWWGRNQPGLSAEACAYLSDIEVTAVACDTAGCDVACVDGQVLAGHGHSEYFLPRGILIVEGLHGLASVPSTGLFLALPLKIAGGTGSPLRVVLLSE